VSDFNVVVATPLVESMKMRTVMSLLGITTDAQKNGIKMSVVFVKDSLLHEARRNAVLKAKGLNATHIFFFDSDMGIQSDAVSKLLSYDKDIVGVNYHAKALPLRSVIKFQDENGVVIQAEVPQNSLFKCFACGTGAMLIKMDVFDRIDQPWFFYEMTPTLSMGEDVWFCRQAQRAGIEVWCSSEIECKHIGDYEY
jgi:hypothetical protein